MQPRIHTTLLSTLVGLILFTDLMPSASAQVTERPAVDNFYRQSDSWSHGAVLSADGRHAAFVSGATDLVPGDTNTRNDVFVRDRTLRTTVRISVSSAGIEGDWDSGGTNDLDISGNGRWVVFSSVSTNLAPGDSNFPMEDVFIHDRDPDGNGIFDEGNGTTELVSKNSAGLSGNGKSNNVSISGNGAKVAFVTRASDLSPPLGGWPYFGMTLVWDRVSKAMTNVSIAFDGSGSPATDASDVMSNTDLSDDGSHITFESKAGNLLDYTSSSSDIDSNGIMDVFYGDTGPSSAMGRIRTSLGHLGQIGAGGDSGHISGDGSQVLFRSTDASVTPVTSSGRSNVYVRNILTGTTTRVSAHSDGSEGNWNSWDGRISSTGRYVAFITEATDLFAGDTSSYEDIVHVDRDPDEDGVFDPSNAVLSLGVKTYEGNQIGWGNIISDLSADGRVISFATTAGNVVRHDTNGIMDGFVRDLDSSCVQPEAYGHTTGGGPLPSNSTGVPSYMGLEGSTSLAAMNLVLRGYDLPDGQFGVPFYGGGDDFHGVANGLRLVSSGGAGIYRLGVVHTGSTGTVSYTMDLTSPPLPGGLILGGSTWNFQFWHRDTVGLGSNFTNAMRITFCD